MIGGGVDDNKVNLWEEQLRGEERGTTEKHKPSGIREKQQNENKDTIISANGSFPDSVSLASHFPFEIVH